MTRTQATVAIVTLSITSAYIALGLIGVLIASPLIVVCLWIIWVHDKRNEATCSCKPPKEACNICGGKKLLTEEG